MKTKLITYLFFASTILAGCGGGSSSGSGAAPVAAKVTITTNNQAMVTGAAINAASTNLGAGFASFAGGVQTTNSNSNKDRVLFNVADYAMKRMNQHKNAPASVVGAATTNNCIVSGTYTVDSGTDYYKETDNNCSDTAGYVYNGHFYITGVVSTPSTFSATMDFDLQYKNNSTTLLALLGSFTISEIAMGTAAQIDELIGSNISVSSGTMTFAMTNFDFKSTYNNNNTTPVITNDFTNYTVSFNDTNPANSAYNFSMDFATNPNNLIIQSDQETYIRTGEFVVKGDASTALKVIILPTSGANIAGTSTGLVTLAISIDGGSTYPTTNTQTWTAWGL